MPLNSRHSQIVAQRRQPVRVRHARKAPGHVQPIGMDRWSFDIVAMRPFIAGAGQYTACVASRGRSPSQRMFAEGRVVTSPMSHTRAHAHVLSAGCRFRCRPRGPSAASPGQCVTITRTPRMPSDHRVPRNVETPCVPAARFPRAVCPMPLSLALRGASRHAPASQSHGLLVTRIMFCMGSRVSTVPSKLGTFPRVERRSSLQGTSG